MATTKSTAITNADSQLTGEKTANQPWVEKAPPFISQEQVAVAAADNDGHIYRVHRLPSNAVILKHEIYNTAITGGTDYDVGGYDTEENGSAVIDVNGLADAIDMSSARTAALDITFEVRAITTEGQKLWEVLGLSEDPKKDIDICFTGVTVGSANGTILSRIFWTI